MSAATQTRPNVGWHDLVTREEIDAWLEMRDWKSWASIALDWSITFAAMALVATWSHPLTIVVALFLIGTRQLGLAVLMHEASHRSLFSNKKVNDWAGNWLCAYPVWSDLYPYRPYHLQHHAHTGDTTDPDLGLVTRIRSIAEHALTPTAAEPRGLTRTTIAAPWERLLVAPNCVNYHMEHHLLITVPHYNLRAMHERLVELGVIDPGCIDRGYAAILRRAAGKREGAATEPTHLFEDRGAHTPPTPRVPPF